MYRWLLLTVHHLLLLLVSHQRLPLSTTAQQPVNIASAGSVPTSPFILPHPTRHLKLPLPVVQEQLQVPPIIDLQDPALFVVNKLYVTSRSTSVPNPVPPPSGTHHTGFPLLTMPLIHAHKRLSSASISTHGPFSTPSTSAEGPVHWEDALTSRDAGATPLLYVHTHDMISLPLHRWGPSSLIMNVKPRRASAPMRLPWQEEEGRRRYEVAYGHPTWNKESEADEGEPIREGAFNVLIGGDAAGQH